MVNSLPENTKLNLILEDYDRYLVQTDRRLYLTSSISAFDPDCDEFGLSTCSAIVDSIIEYNRQDAGVPVEKRKPIRLYINSPGGDIVEGFSVVGAIETSKTPVYTVNIGGWYSMAFLIGIAWHKRFSLPHMVFLMHDGTNFTFDSGLKAQDKMEFDRRFEKEVIKKHVLKYSNMTSEEYDKMARVEYYLLPEDAKERGFIDEIVDDLDTIL